LITGKKISVEKMVKSQIDPAKEKQLQGAKITGTIYTLL
jgi:hypothetical protein